MMNDLIRILLIVLTVGIALGVGFFLRMLVVRRLSKTFLDNWIVQTIGVLIFLPAIAMILVFAPAIWGNSFEALVSLWNDLIINGNTFGFTQADLITIAKNFLASIMILVLGIGIARTIMTLSIRGIGDARIDINIRTLLGRICYIIILTFAFFWILTIWKVEIAIPVAFIGTFTVACAFAIQDVLKNLVAGFYLLMERPFHIGDLISTAAYTGRVEDVQIRATKLRLISGELITIPNSLMFGGIVLNNSFYGENRIIIDVTLPQELFMKKETFGQIICIVEQIETVIKKPEPMVMLTNYTGDKITLGVHFWVTNNDLATISDVMYEIRQALPQADLAIHRETPAF